MADWATAPPLVFLVEGLVRGLAGPTQTPEVTDADVDKLMSEAGPSILRDAKPDLKLVEDIEVLRARNVATQRKLALVP